MKPDLDPDALEKARVAYCGCSSTGRCAARVLEACFFNTGAGGARLETAIRAYLDHLGLVTLRPLIPEDLKK